MMKKVVSFLILVAAWGQAALPARADESFLGGFVSAVSAESAAARLEARNMALVAPRVVAGAQNLVSSNGLTVTAWDTTAIANGWHEVTEPTGGEKASLLVANVPAFAVEGGRLETSVTWDADAVHWVRNKVIVPRGVTLTVAAGAVVKFGEHTGMFVEDGGTVRFNGNSSAPVILTSFADDVYGGDSDFGATNAVWNSWSLTAQSGGTISDLYTQARYGTVGTFPTLSMPTAVTASRVTGKARVSVSFDTAPTKLTALTWRTVDGTAKYGTDFTQNGGTAVWVSGTTVYFDIPLVNLEDVQEVRTFTIELVTVEGANANPSRLSTTVSITGGDGAVDMPTCAVSEESEAIRLEARDPDPKPEPVPATLAIEGGRLPSNAIWDSAATNFVLNTVVIPSGVTLTVVTNAVVFFTPNTGIKVELGGALRVVGSAEGPALFTATTKGDWSLAIVEGGTFADSYALFEKTTISQHPTVTVPNGVEVSEKDGEVRVPVAVSGERTSAFRVKWRAIDGTAKFGEDYTLASGEVEWTGTSQGTKYITIPIPDDGVEEESETFVVELVSAQGANIGGSYRCTVLVRDGTAALVPLATCVESEESAAIRLEMREPDPKPEPVPASIAIDGGRLLSNVTWDTSVTNFVLNTVVVPSGVTLTVVTNAYVHFTPNTGIKVEPGGALRCVGSQEGSVVFAAANDGDYTIDVVSGGTFTDTWTAFRNLNYGGFGTASLDGSLVVDSDEGVMRIPVYINGSRTSTFSVDWDGSDGTTGTIVWNNANEGKKWIELPIEGRAEGFSLRLVEGRGINISGTAHEIAVKVFTSAAPKAICAVSAESEAVRLENRAEGTLARALVRGTEYIAADGDTRAVKWDSTQVADGWQANGTLVRNSQSIAIECGRLPSDATWSNDVTHLVRSWVVVPKGVTLRIEAGTVVKFAEQTGFKVEAGGKLIVAGTEESPVVYTAAADDTIGGDSDLREATPNDGDYAVNIVSGGTYTDSNCAVRYTTFSNLGTATMTANALAALTDGIVRIPVTISTDRTTKFCVDWRTGGSRSCATASGRITWNSKNDGTKYIELPLVSGSLTNEFDTFTVELYESQGINISTTARRCEVTIYSNDQLPVAVGASSEASAAVRFENRDFEWSYGAPLVCGTEWKSADGEARAVAWDTTAEADGWLDVGGASLLVRNDSSIAIEGGRLSSSATWGNGVTHVVRNWVVVPTNVTLTIAAGTVVKFCDETGIKVEPGGRLVSAGTAASDVIFTSVNDDTAGGDTDLISEDPLPGDYAITVVSGGTFTDTFTQMRYGTSGTFGSVSLPAKVVAKKDGGIVRIPVSISTSRTTPFAVDWIAYGESLGRVLVGRDVLIAPNDEENVIGGRIEWTSSSQGTKYIEIPLDRMADAVEDECFTIELVTGLGINLNLSSSVCEVDLYDTHDTLVGTSNGYAASDWCELAPMDASAGTGLRFAQAEESIRYSTRWHEDGASCVVSARRTGGSSVQEGTETATNIHESSDAAEGHAVWNVADYENGRYDLEHKILDAGGGMVKSDTAAFIVNHDVVTHAGRLATDETWTAEKVHLVVADVTVPSGITLTIAPDAIVKFMPGTRIVVEAGGLGICKGAVLTHAYDDVMGGDTFFDGTDALPEYGGYWLYGEWESSGSMHYRAYMWGGEATVYGIAGADGDIFTNAVQQVVLKNDAQLVLPEGGCLEADGRLALGERLTVHAQSDPANTLILRLYGCKVAPDVSHTELVLYIDGVRSEAGYSLASAADGLYIVGAGGANRVLFDLGEHGTRSSGGTLLQFLDGGASIFEPRVATDTGWFFVGWDVDPATLQAGDVATALYKTRLPDLHVDSVTVPATGLTGEKVTINWTVGNTGYQSWNSKTIERLRLVDANDPERTKDIALTSEKFFVGSGATATRSYEWQIPLRNVVGEWRVIVETAVDASNEFGGDNSCTSATTIVIGQSPLPDLVFGGVTFEATPAVFEPSSTGSVSYVVRNTGTGIARAPWYNRVYFYQDGNRVTVSHDRHDEDLGPGEEVELSTSFIVPNDLSGDVTLAVAVDAEDDIPEISDGNPDENAAFEATPNAYIPKRLFVSLSDVQENGPPARMTIMRTGDVSSPLTLSITAANANGNVTYPGIVTLSAGSRWEDVAIVPIDNSVIDGKRKVVFTVLPPEASGFESVSHTLTVFDNEVPSLSVSFSKTKVREGEDPILVTITREFVTDEPLVVYLNGPSTSRCTYPSAVTIPANEATFTFELGAANNEAAEIGASFTLRASAAGYNSTTQSFDVEDDDIPAVTLEIYPEELSEGAGTTAAYAILSRVDQKNISEAITVNLSASMPKQLILPASMTIPAYTMAVRFAIGTVDNSEDDGDRDVTIAGSIYIPSCGCSAQPSTGDMIEANVRVIDNDGPTLKLTASPSTMKEGLEHAGDLVLSHNSALAEDLMVALSYDTPGEIDIPEYVVIPAGETSVRVPVRTIDDGVTDGGRLVSVYADDDTGVFSSASTWIQVSDQNLPDYKVTAITHPGTVFAGGTFSFEFETANTGFVDGTSDVEYDVYLIGGRRGNATAPSNKVGHGKIKGGVPQGESLTTPFSMTAPDVVADYRIVVVLDPSGKAGELDGANNTFTSPALSVSSAYQPTASIAVKKAFLQGEAVTIEGIALLPDGTTPAPGVGVDVYVVAGSFRRTLSVTTDNAGRFTAVYTPSQGEAGHYKVGACYPGVNSSVVHDEFDILGMRRTSNANIIWDIGQGESGERYVYIENRSAVPITGLSATFENIPEECDFSYTLPDNIPGQSRVLLTMYAEAVGVTEQTDYKTITARLECNEGLELSFPLYFHSKAQKAYLRSNPKSISTTMAIGNVRCIDITIANDGKGDSGLITAALPDVPWLKFVTYDTIENLKYGQSATLTLAVAPTYDDGLVLNNPRKGGSLVISCENGTGCVIPLSFTPVSDGTGSVKVDALDNNTYVLESSPHLANASVVLSNPYTGEIVAKGTTGASGAWAGKSIPEGTYKATVSADKHDSWTGMVTVEPGKQATITPFLQCKIVTVTWNVEKTEIEDSYEITLLLDYETRVPAPVVKTHMPSELPELDEGDSYAFSITLENTGVIAAEKVTLAMPEIPGYTITLSDNGVAVPAKSSVTLSAVLSRPARNGRARLLAAKDTVVTVTKTVCFYNMFTYVVYPCGKEHPEYSYETLIGHGVCTTETIREYVIKDQPPKPAGPVPDKPIRPEPQPPSPPVEPQPPKPSPDVFVVTSGCDAKSLIAECLKLSAPTEESNKISDALEKVKKFFDAWGSGGCTSRVFFKNNQCGNLDEEARKRGQLAQDSYRNPEKPVSIEGTDRTAMTSAEVKRYFTDSGLSYSEDADGTVHAGRYTIKPDGTITTDSGLQATMYRDDNGGITVAYTGTQIDPVDVQDLVVDAENVLCQHTQQYEDAADLLSRISDRTDSDTHISLTGHSLGGGLATYAYLRNKKTHPEMTATTYNAAGICSNLIPDIDECEESSSDIINYRTLDDWVSIPGFHVGRMVSLCDWKYSGHDAKNFGLKDPDGYDMSTRKFNLGLMRVGVLGEGINLCTDFAGRTDPRIQVISNLHNYYMCVKENLKDEYGQFDRLIVLTDNSAIGIRASAAKRYGVPEFANKNLDDIINSIATGVVPDSIVSSENELVGRCLDRILIYDIFSAAQRYIVELCIGTTGGNDIADYCDLNRGVKSGWNVDADELHDLPIILKMSRSEIQNLLAPVMPSMKSEEAFESFTFDDFSESVGDVMPDDQKRSLFNAIWQQNDNGTPTIDIDKYLKARNIIYAIWIHMLDEGATSPNSYLTEGIQGLIDYYAVQSKSVCASVKLQLSQTLTMTREAFDGTLTLYNGHDSVAIKDIALDISILDEEGNECKDLFEYFANGVSGAMSEGSVLDGGLSVSSGGSGSALVRFIPKRSAAPTENKLYRFGGTVTYIDPFSGEKATVRLTPVSLTVSPSPYLHLDYFVQRDVYADDPFTPDVVEASMPAELAVLVRNVGAANAKNVTIASARPEVVKNEKGLAVDFNLQDYNLDGSAVDGEAAHIGLNNVSLGTIAPNEAKVAQWWLTSSIQGHFTGMSATVSPVNSWNTPDTMLVDPEVGVHKLIRSVVADDDSLPDFLVSEAADIYGTPNKLYFSSGDVANVYVSRVALNGRLAGAEVTIAATVSPGQRGWNCGYVACPGLFRYEIASIMRGDGTEISTRNAWITDRVFRDGADPLMEERLVLFDTFETASPQTYMIVLSAKPHGETVEVAEFDIEDGIVEYAARNAVHVVFSKPVNPDTFTVKDLVLRRQGTAVNNISGVTIAPVGEDLTEYAISGLAGYCSANGRYELVVQCAGIEDLSGRPGVSGRSVAWLLAPQDAPYILASEGNPDSPVQNLDGIVAVTSMPVTEESAGNVSVMLNGKDVSRQVTVTFSDDSGTKCQIEGLDSLQQNDGEYTLVIDASRLVGVNGGAGVNNAYTVSWTRDTKAPVLNSLERNEGLGGTTFIVDLSEDADASTISLENFVLTRNNAEAVPQQQSASPMRRARLAAGQDEVSLPPSAKLVPLGNGKYAVSGLDSVLLDDGVYTLTFNASGVADKAGNLSSGTRSVTWSSDVTPPDGVTDIAVSARSGDVDVGFYTNSRELTISGKAGESGLAIDIFAQYAGGEEVLLASPELDGSLSFAATVNLPGDGAMSIIIRLTDPSGNSTDTVFQVFVDMIYLEATITGVPEPDSAADVLTITFSAEPDEATALAAPFTMTLDGAVIDISSAVAITKVDAVTYTVSGLGDFTSEYGDYVFTYDTRHVVKASSGISGLTASVIFWTNAAADIVPPVIEEVLFDGETPREAYVETNCFNVVSVRFSEPVNIPDLVERDMVGQAFSIQLLSDSGDITGSIPAEDVSWDESTCTAVWTLDISAIPRGRARFVVDSSFVKDSNGNPLAATDRYDVMSGSKKYAPIGVLQGMADSYAAPTLFDWNNDGLLDLFVGEKTADGKGKVRMYMNGGDTFSPEYAEYTYLAKGGEDVEFTAQGCLGAQIAFDGSRNAVMYLATSQGTIYSWRYRSSDAETGEAFDFDPWFDHDTDSRFAGLKRTCLFAYDVDGDGEDEVVVSGQASPMFWMKRVVSDGTATTRCTLLTDDEGGTLAFPPGQSHTSAVMFDVNGDFVADLVTGDTDGNVWVYYGTQGGCFAATPVQAYANPDVGIKRSRLAVGDIDGDGVEDILVGRSDGTILVLKGEVALAQVVNFKVVEEIGQAICQAEMAGPAGVGEERYVKPGDWMDYTIYFENATNAQAAAQDVYVTLPKDAGLDWDSFELGEVVFGDNIDTGLSGAFDGVSSYALPGTNWSVRTEVAHAADKVVWHLRIIDPTTSDNYPSDPYAGFLPPNDETGRGEGHLRFSVNVKEDATPGSVIRASAVIEFDPLNGNAPIETDPAWSNTVAQVVSVTISDGEGGSSTQDLIVGMPYGDTLPESPTNGKTGYTFAGWRTGPNGTGRLITAGSLVEAGDVGIYADWTANTYEVVFHGNGGEGEMPTQTNTYDAASSLASNTFTFARYRFAGWATNETGEVQYEDGATVSNLTVVAYGTFDLFAAWEPLEIRTPVEIDGVTTNLTLIVGEPFGELPTPAPRPGYSFGGWYTGPNGTGIRVTPDTPVPDGLTALYAYWIAGESEYAAPTLHDAPAYGGIGSAYKGGTFNGYAKDADGNIAGTFTLAVKKPAKGKTTAAATLTFVSLANGKKTKIAGTVDLATGAGSGGLAGLTLGADAVGGTVAKAGALEGGADAVKAKDKAALGVLAKFTGKSYVIVLEGSDVPAQGGFSTLAISMAAKGKAKVSGVLADGTKVTASGVMTVGDAYCCVPVIYSKKSKFGFVAWFDKNTRQLVDVTALTPWKNTVKPAFTMDWAVAASGAKGSLAAGTRTVALDGAKLSMLVPDAIEQTPVEIPLTVKGAKWDAGKAAKVAYKGGVVSVAGANVSGLKLAFTAKTGTFKGSFTVYSVKGGKLVKTKFTVNGAVVDGVAYGAAFNKKAGSVPVEIE